MRRPERSRRQMHRQQTRHPLRGSRRKARGERTASRGRVWSRHPPRHHSCGWLGASGVAAAAAGQGPLCPLPDCPWLGKQGAMVCLWMCPGCCCSGCSAQPLPGPLQTGEVWFARALASIKLQNSRCVPREAAQHSPRLTLCGQGKVRVARTLGHFVQQNVKAVPGWQLSVAPA